MAIEKITVPDFGDVQEITVLEVYVSAGDKVEKEDPLVALESEKAVMDIPSPHSGIITEIKLQEGDTVKSDDLIALLDTADKESETPADPKDKSAEETAEPSGPVPGAEPEPSEAHSQQEKNAPPAHATPSVRAYARESGADLSAIEGSGPKGRILKEDVDSSLKTAPPEAGSANAFSSIEQPPLEDFSKYGPTETAELSRIQKISGPSLHRSWLAIPHVTHFEEADITELEAFRKQVNEEKSPDSVKISPLIFVIKTVASSLKQFPLFNSSLIPGNEKVILKKFYNIGIAVDTPDGLVVPVIKNADIKSIREIGLELNQLSSNARNGKLTIPDIQGATFTISSLGGIGGTGFTPIVNGTQVAILGLSKSYQKPVWNGEGFIPRLTLPFSLSYDHRVIDGAEAARFCLSLRRNLEDLKRTLL